MVNYKKKLAICLPYSVLFHFFGKKWMANILMKKLANFSKEKKAPFFKQKMFNFFQQKIVNFFFFKAMISQFLSKNWSIF